MTQTPHTFTLRTGWFDIEVNCRETPTWFAPLRQRYEKFLVPEVSASPAVRVTLLAPPPSSAPNINQPPKFTEHGIRFLPPGWEGEVNLAEKSGWMRPASNYVIEEIDYFLRVVCALYAFQAGGLLFHAAGIIREGKAYVFFGHSGAGKTTLSRLSSHYQVLNDDLVLLQPQEDRSWHVYSTPFFNPTQIDPQGNDHAPLVGLYSLVQAKQVFLEPASPGLALAEIIANVPVLSTDTRQTGTLFTRGQTLLTQVPIFRLHFRKDATFWDIL